MTGEQKPVWRIVAAKLRDAMKGFGTGNERAAFYAESIPRQNLTSAANAGNYLRPRFGTSLRSDRRKFIAVCGILLRCSWFDDPGGEFMATEALLEQIL